MGRLFLFFVGGFALLFVRLAWLQVIRAESFTKKILADSLVAIDLPAGRGRILDRQGRPLADRVESYTLSVFPSRFRERNRLDALTDLIVAWRPSWAAAWTAPLPKTRRAAIRERLRRFTAARREAARWLGALLAAAPDALDFTGPRREELTRRFKGRAWPDGVLVAPASRYGTRLLDAMIRISTDPSLTSRVQLRKRLARAATLGDALGSTPADVLRAIDGELDEFTALALEVGEDDTEALLMRLFEREQQDLGRMERRVEGVLHDRIAISRFGTPDLDQIDREERRALADELRVPDTDVRRLGGAWEDLEAVSRGEADPDDAAKIEEGRRILAGRRVRDLDRAERSALARAIEFWSEDATSLKRALGKSVLVGGDERREYLSFSKEWARRLQFKGGVPFDLYRGASFTLAARVWRSHGLGDLGFRVRAAYGRAWTHDEEGTAVFLLGRVTRQGKALGGLELVLGEGGGAAGGPLLGRPGRFVRRREPDGRFAELPESTAPEHGRDVRLTLDIELQGFVEEKLESLMRRHPEATGATAAVIDVESGDILALAQAPRVSGRAWIERWFRDADRLRETRAAREAWRRGDLDESAYLERRRRLILEADRQPVLDRAADAGFQTRYPPGSVMKIFGAAALLEEGILDPDVVVPTSDRGPVDLHLALVKSSNQYFRRQGRPLGKARLIDWYERFGMFHPIPYLITRRSCNARRDLARGGESSFKNAVIGQGSLGSSVLEIASMTSTLARGGLFRTPRIVLEIGGRPEPRGLEHRVKLSDETLHRIVKAMRAVGARKGGRAGEEVDLAAKTGTAELHGYWGRLHNAYSTGFAPAGRPSVAVCVCLERTRASGSRTVPTLAEIARRALRDPEESR